MSLTLINRACTIVQRTADTVDTYGDPTKTETSTDTVCELQPLKHQGSGDEVEGGNIGITTYRLYLNGAVALNADDAVVVDGATYELVGDAVARRKPWSGEDWYTEALVRRVNDG